MGFGNNNNESPNGGRVKYRKKFIIFYFYFEYTNNYKLKELSYFLIVKI